MTTFTDMMATFAAIAGVELPDDAGEDSFNMLPVLLGEKRDGPVRETMLNDTGNERMAIRRGPWKCIPVIEGRDPRVNAEAKGELYNVAGDHGETTNVYDDHTDMAQELMAILQKQIDDGHSRPM
jgi:arylsulfatase A-like enzyme